MRQTTTSCGQTYGCHSLWKEIGQSQAAQVVCVWVV